jgi:hypothetical protein
MDRPAFRVCVVGDCSDPGVVEAKLSALLRRKLATHAVTIYAGGPIALPAFLFAEARGLATERYGDADPDDELGTGRNTKLLNTCSAFIAFGPASSWTRDVADLVLRAEVSGYAVRRVRVST